MGLGVTAEVKSTRRPDSLASGATHPTAPRDSDAGRCNAPQRAPIYRPPAFPDTPWGRARAGKGWSLRQLASFSGINAGELSKIERGLASITPDQAHRLVDAYSRRPDGTRP